MENKNQVLDPGDESKLCSLENICDIGARNSCIEKITETSFDSLCHVCCDVFESIRCITNLHTNSALVRIKARYLTFYEPRISFLEPQR